MPTQILFGLAFLEEITVRPKIKANPNSLYLPHKLQTSNSVLAGSYVGLD